MRPVHFPSLHAHGAPSAHTGGDLPVGPDGASSHAQKSTPSHPGVTLQVVPRQLVAQQLLREAVYPEHVRRVVEQVIDGNYPDATEPSEQVMRMARHIGMHRGGNRQALPAATLHALQCVAEDVGHPLQHDARLLLDIVWGVAHTSLDEALASCLKRHFELDGEIALHPDSRTYNSHLPSIALAAQDYGTVGRTLMLQGATHLFENQAYPDRRQALSSVMWSLQKCPRNDQTRKTFIDFCMVDPLDQLNVYEG